MLGSSGSWGSCSNANIHCSSLSKLLCILCSMQHRIGFGPYSPSRQSGKSTPQCQRQYMEPCLANRNSPLLTPFQRYLVTCPLPPSLPLEPMPRGSKTHSTTYYLLATGFLHPVEPQASLPAGYPADYACCVGDHPVHSTNYLAVHTVYTVCWIQGRQGSS